MIIFPYTVTPLEVGRPRSIQALEAAIMGDRRIVLSAQKDAEVQEPVPDDIYSVGTLCEVKQVLKLPEGQLRVLIEGKTRVQVEEIVQEDPFYHALVSRLEEPAERSDSTESGGAYAHGTATVRTVLEIGQEAPG